MLYEPNEITSVQLKNRLMYASAVIGVLAGTVIYFLV